MIVLLYGADELAIRRRLQQLRDLADGGSGMLVTNLTELDGRDVKAAEIIAPAHSIPFLAPRRLVVVEHFFERFESRGAPAAGEATGLRRLAAFEPLLAALQSGLPETTILVFTGVSDDKVPFANNPMLKALKAVPGVEDGAFPRLEKDGLTRYIRAEAATRGIRFKAGQMRSGEGRSDEDTPQEADPAQLLANLFQSDTLALNNELDKLALYTRGREVSVADVNEICAGDRDATSFEFVDAVQDGRLAVAMERLAWLLRDGEQYQGLVAALLTGYRRTANILDLLDDNAPVAEVARTLGPAGRYPGLRDAAIRRARKIGHRGLRRAYAAIVESERAFKSGETAEEVAFELMLMRLTGLVGPPPPRPLVPR